MLRKRVIVCLDVDGARVVKGVRFEHLRDMGDPVALAERYQQQGADEIVFLDVSASHEGRETVRDVVQRTAECLFIPLTVGGGVRTVHDVEGLLRAGADKVAANTAAVATPDLLTRAADRFGAQCVVASVDARSVDGRYEVFTHGGRTATGLEAVAWCRECVNRGAGEILLTAIDSDGARSGYDLGLTRTVRDAVTVPLVASGGAGAPEHFVEVFEHCDVDAALAAGIFHEGLVEVADVKAAMQAAGVTTRTGTEG